MTQGIRENGSMPPGVAAALASREIIPPADMDESKSFGAFKTISEAAKMLSLPQHVLRFWESKFPQIRPLKLKGGRRYYRPQDIETLFTVKYLLYKEGYTIKGARKAIAQGRKPPEETFMPPSSGGGKKKKKQAAPVDDTPLFQAVMASPAAPVTEMAQVPVPPVTGALDASRRRELESIHQELLSLREMVRGLPSLKNA